MGIISWAVWGLFVGLFARLIRPGRQAIGCWWTIVLGVVGSLVGGFIATELLHVGDKDDFDLGSFLIAVAASAILLALWERVERALPDRTRQTPPGGGV
ncbi:MAG: GlsB/YeaQ/YmgE family stress response membrane protein [Thermoleophilaceae bacterium]